MQLHYAQCGVINPDEFDNQLSKCLSRFLIGQHMGPILQYGASEQSRASKNVPLLVICARYNQLK